jgi:putative heme-binding domain-containing protein
LAEGWKNPKRALQILRAAEKMKDNSQQEQIVAALQNADPQVAKLAAEVVKKNKIDPAKVAAAAKPSGPAIATLKVDDVIESVLKTKGDRARGEQLFTSVGCVACHTVKQGEPLKGPFLGNIADTYKRRELAEAILIPNKTLAQGFVTNNFTLKDGTVHMGFVTQEAADKVSVRNVAAQEIVMKVSDIAKRETLEISMMPPGLVNSLTVSDLASVLDYLEGLAKK